MSERTLVIGNYNYSTWSMRPWLLIKAFDIPCEVIVESLCGADLSERLRRHSPSARVPVLKDGDIDVWDSLAICEYLSEHYLDGKGWPADKTARAFARSVSAEMHSGFSALRGEMPMNIRARRRIEPSDACLRDIDRVTEIWETGRRNFAHQGNFLAGPFSIADCLFAPVVMRFATYGVRPIALAGQYLKSIQNHPAVQAWVALALEETEVVIEDEAGEPID